MREDDRGISAICHFANNARVGCFSNAPVRMYDLGLALPNYPVCIGIRVYRYSNANLHLAKHGQ